MAKCLMLLAAVHYLFSHYPDQYHKTTKAMLLVSIKQLEGTLIRLPQIS